MQSKGAITLLAVLIALACIYQLSFTGVSSIIKNKADKYAEAAVAAEQQKPSFAEVSDLDKAYYLDSIRKERNSFYLDSVSAEKVYLGYTFKEVQEKEINLGLDLKGGMNVMLEVQLRDSPGRQHRLHHPLLRGLERGGTRAETGSDIRNYRPQGQDQCPEHQ